jgi:uncharacterized protein (DUF1810 family)
MKSLNRFLEAQESSYNTALNEIKSGRKQSHWMWYVFPQLKGLGFSETSQFYAINDIDEAKEYLYHPLLGARLKEISRELIKLNESDAKVIFGSPDHLKLKSCMTLFSVIDESRDSLFEKVIEKFFDGNLDSKTLRLLNKNM